MTQLTWLEDAEGFVSGEHHIRRSGDASRYRWHVETRGNSRRMQSRIVTTSYASLRAAKNAAHHVQREQLQRDAVIGHAVVGCLAFLALAALFPNIGSVIAFVAAMALFYLGLRSLTFSASIKLDDAWGWTRDGGISQPPRLSDRLVRTGIARLRRASTVAIDAEATPAVRVLPPTPSE